MKNAKIITHILLPVFIGLIIGGAVADNTAAWVSGLVLGIVDIFVGISLQYYLNRQQINDNGYSDFVPESRKHLNNTFDESVALGDALQKAYESAMAIEAKVKKLSYNHSAREVFTKSELVDGTINLREAQTRLSSNEYFYINAVYEVYKQKTERILLNYEGYMNTTDEMIAHFDLIAPWYKYCGNDGMRMSGEMATMADQAKSNFRKRAWALIDQKRIFSAEWEALRKEFRNEFYSEWGDTADEYQNNSQENKLSENMATIIAQLNMGGGTRQVKTLFDDDNAAKFLIELRNQTDGTPPLMNFAGLFQISTADFDGYPAIIYFFRTHPGAFNMIKNVILVKDNNYQIRFFVVETDFMPFLCEYKEGKHLNYGPIDLQNISLKMDSILNRKES